MSKKILQGVVISDKMDKTVVVKTESIKKHPVYKKLMRTNKKYKAHDDKNEFKIGDIIQIVESKPISKDKHWRVVKKVGVNAKMVVMHEHTLGKSTSSVKEGAEND